MDADAIPAGLCQCSLFEVPANGATKFDDGEMVFRHRTHIVGKWDVGMATEAHHPKSRGYESFYGYWHHSNDYWSHATGVTSSGACSALPVVRDLWRYNATYDGPAIVDQNGPHCSQLRQEPPGERCVYEEELLSKEATRIIDAHDVAAALFLFYSSHLIHVPLQVPKKYENAFAFIKDPFRRVAHAMANYLDDQLGEIVDALKRRGMWSNTLLTFHSDNGGEILGAGTCGGNNWPLTGGKFSNWEGGIRVNAFVAGGALPVARRGTAEDSLSAVWDWYATYAHLAGVDPTDHAAAAVGLPPIDSVNLWHLLARGKADGAAAPRDELPIGDTGALPNGDGKALVGGLLRANGTRLYKLLVGAPDRAFIIDQYVTTGPSWPNASSHLVPLAHGKLCGRRAADGCLFDVAADPFERHNLAQNMPGLFDAMLGRVDALQQTVYSPDRGKTDERACVVAKENEGYWGPFLL